MQPTKLLDTSNLIDVLDVLDDHGYSGVSYYKLGLCLGLHPRTLDVIKEDNKGYTKSCLRKCLTAWLEQRDSVMKRGVPTYDTLIRALRKMGENAAADGIERGINTKQLEEDEVELKATNINMHDAPGADGSQHLLNEPPPEKHTDSTQESESTVPIATVTDEIDIETCRTVKATRISIDKENKWKRVDEEDLLKQLASPEDNVPTNSDEPSLGVPFTNEPTKSKPTENGPTKNGSAENEPAENGLAENENGLAENGSAENENGPTKNRPTENGFDENGPTENGPTKNGPTENAPTKNGPTENAPTKNGPTENGPTKNGPTENGPTENGPTENGPTENGPTENGLAENGSAKNELTKNEPAENGLSENENGLAKNGSSENEQAEFKFMEKLIKYFKANESKKLSRNWVYFIDSGGQPAYRELLPLFTRAAALNIITIDLTKGLDEKCKFQYRIDQRMSPIDTELKYSNRDLIQSTISSEAMLNPIEIPDVFKSDKHKDICPHYLILGTRKDDKLVTEDKLKKMNESLKEYRANKKVIPHNIRRGSIIFPVNTLLPAGSIEREEASVELCNAISNCGVAMTIMLPI
uniref:Death domain-containing protein n=1 Tax=Amphimedon queenslandica TaxID=400682 RepID=A0A1X7T8U4_AMPQE